MNETDRLLMKLDQQIEEDKVNEKEQKEKKIRKIAFTSAGILLFSLLGYYVITKESKSGQVRVVNDDVSTVSDDYCQNDFDSLVNSYVDYIGSKCPGLSRDDITKFVALANIDKIVSEYPELADKLYSNESAEEYLGDASKVIGAVVIHNMEANNTSDFVNVSDAINPSQKSYMTKMESYVKRITVAAQKGETDLVNELAREYLDDLSTGELSKMPSGIGYAGQTCIAILTDGFVKDSLNNENYSRLLILRDNEKYVSNIFAMYNECSQNIKTLQR